MRHATFVLLAACSTLVSACAEGLPPAAEGPPVREVASFDGAQAIAPADETRQPIARQDVAPRAPPPASDALRRLRNPRPPEAPNDAIDELRRAIPAAEQNALRAPPGDTNRPTFIYAVALQCEEREDVAGAAGRADEASDARAKAIRWLSLLDEDYAGKTSPRFPGVAARPFFFVDQNLYRLAWEYEQAADFDHARKAYTELVERFPRSQRVAYAHFALGEMALRERGDDARRWYAAVLDDPADAEARAGELVAFALLRMGQIDDARGDAAAARESWDRLLREHPKSMAAKEVPPVTPGDASAP